MRALKMAVAGSMVGAALLVSACGTKTENTTTTDNTAMVTDLNATEGMGGETTSDNMTSVDGATGNGMGMSNDSMMSNSTGSMSGSSMSNTTSMGNSTGNAM